MGNVNVVFWWDTEDFVTPESDDIILDVVKAFEDRKVRACFKMVGEKVRTLEKRGRTDVIAALDRHEIGYHTDSHSVHPTAAETADGKRWREGIDALRAREEPGFRDVSRVFHRTPEVYGQPGASYAPQYYRLLREWGVPTYLGGSVYLGLNDRPSHFQGIFNLARMCNVSASPSPNVPAGTADPAIGELDACVRLLSERGGVISSSGHPCEFCTPAFWDAVNFAKGANPPRERWRGAPLRTPESRRASLGNLTNLIDECLRRGVRVVTAAEARAMYPDKARGMRLAPPILRQLAAHLARGILYFEADTWAMTAGEILSALVHCVCEAGPAGGIPEGVPFESIDGPDERGAARSAPCGTVSREALLEAARGLRDFLARERRLPDDVAVGSGRARPEDFAALLASAVERLGRDGRLPEVLPWRASPYLLGGLVRGLGDELGWIIHSPSMTGATLKEYATLQAWSFKPAIYAM